LVVTYSYTCGYRKFFLMKLFMIFILHLAYITVVNYRTNFYEKDRCTQKFYNSNKDVYVIARICIVVYLYSSVLYKSLVLDNSKTRSFKIKYV
jgi:hypothetical protein